MSAAGGLTLDDVLEADELEDLGKPEMKDKPSSTDTAINVEFRKYIDPRLDSIATQAFVLASDLTGSFTMSDMVENPRERAWEAAEQFRDRLASRDEENPVFVSKEIIDLLEGDDRAVAYLRFRGDSFHYPVTLRSHDELLEELENIDVVGEEAFEEASTTEEIAGEMDEWRHQYINKVESEAFSNNIIVPVYADGNASIPERTPVASIRTPEDELLANPELDYGEFVRGENELEDAEEFQEATADLVPYDEGYSLLMDLSSVESGDITAEVEEGNLTVYDDGRPVYQASVEDEMDDSVDEVVKQSQVNGVYSFRLK